MSPEVLHQMPRSRLAQLAKDQGIAAWSSLSKPELVAQLTRSHSLARDQIEVVVEDAHWFDVRWTITPATMERMSTILGGLWRMASPILHLYRCGNLETSVPSRRLIQSIVLPKGASHWHLQIDQPGAFYQLELGYGTAQSEFHPITHSSLIRTDEIRTAVSAGPPSPTTEHVPPATGASLFLHANAEVTIRGQTQPGSTVAIDDDVFPVDERGRFEIRRPLEDGRTMLPITATSSDRTDQRTLAFVIEHHRRDIESEPPKRNGRSRR